MIWSSVFEMSWWVPEFRDSHYERGSKQVACTRPRKIEGEIFLYWCAEYIIPKSLARNIRFSRAVHVNTKSPKLTRLFCVNSTSSVSTVAMEIPVKAVGVVTGLLDGRREIWVRIPAKACIICFFMESATAAGPLDAPILLANGHRHKATRPWS
jgi:hypothetical protein